MSSSNTIDDIQLLTQELPDFIRSRVIDFLTKRDEFMQKPSGTIMTEYLDLVDRIPPDNLSLHNLLFEKAQEYITGDGTPRIFTREQNRES